MRVLVTGSTGYIGGELVPALLDAGHDVTLLVRDPNRLPQKSWMSKVEIKIGDAIDPKCLLHALQGIQVAFYLIHSMAADTDFTVQDHKISEVFGSCAAQSGVSKIIYLSALGDPRTVLSSHLASRHRTGISLAHGGIPVLEFRAGPVIGAGSLPFEMIRYLTERVPVMVCPRWVFTKVQPIALGNVLEYLLAGIHLEISTHEVMEIGGSDVMTYGEMMTGYAKVRGLRRAMIRVPVLTPRLSSYWVHWVTPIRSKFARPIVDGLRNEVIVNDIAAHQAFPEIDPMNYEAAVSSALSHLHPRNDSLTYSDHSTNELPGTITTDDRGLIREHRFAATNQSQTELFDSIQSLGGATGWYADWAWRIRAGFDRLIGGIGMRRNLHRIRPLSIGDELDFWRVEDVSPPHRLLLRAEMKLPGEAWLEFKTITLPDGSTGLVQSSYFAPKGLFGIVYWWVLHPIHTIVFNGLVQFVRSRAAAKGVPSD